MILVNILRLMDYSYYVLASPQKHVYRFLVNLFVDAFTGGLVLYFWLIVEGEAWIRNITKKALKVVLLFLFRRVILNYFLGIFLGPKTDFVVGFHATAEQPA